MPRKIEETETIEEVTTSVDIEELVEFYAPKSRELQSDIFVGLNGKNLQIQRGKHVKIPRWAYEILTQSEDQATIALERSEAAQGMIKY